MELPVSELSLALLVLVALGAGFIDSIAGGGGLLTVPAMLAAGLPPAATLGTNKLQAVFGSGSAAYNFHRRGAVDVASLRSAVATTFVGAAVGAWLVRRLDPRFLERGLPILLIAMALWFLFKRDVGEQARQARLSSGQFATTVAPAVGFYDGFFGPGTGSFFAAAFVGLRGCDLTRATAATKVLNFTSNVAALMLFVLGGVPVWIVGLSMAVGQLVGARLGSNLVLARGSSLVRPLLVVVSIAISIRLLVT